MNCFGTKITGMIHFGAGKIRKSPGTPAAKLWLSEMQGLICEAQYNADQQGDSQDVWFVILQNVTQWSFAK
jgi:hypothetical protein